VQITWWLRHLQYRGCTLEQQNSALQTLRDRYLVEVTFDQDNGTILIGMHNLVRSIALSHHQKILTLEE
jgi:hypothetical protein